MGKLDLVFHPTECQCYDKISLQDGFACVCCNDERMVRARIYKANIPSLTTDERQRIIDEAEYCAKGNIDAEAMMLLGDADLCRELMTAWRDFARKHGLIG